MMRRSITPLEVPTRWSDTIPSFFGSARSNSLTPTIAAALLDFSSVTK